MKRTIFASSRQACLGAAFFAAIFGTALMLGAGSFKTWYSAIQNISKGLLESGFHDKLLSEAAGSDAMTLALPILSALPCTASCIEDIESGFIKEYLPRAGKRGYLAGKLAACLISGGLGLLLGLLLFYGTGVLVFLPLEAAPKEPADISVWLTPLFSRCILFFFSGAFWSLTGMTLAAATGSRVMAYVSPFVVYYMLIILCERYLKNCYILYPKEWITPESWPGGVWGAVLWLTEMTAMWAVCFLYFTARRLDRL